MAEILTTILGDTLYRVPINYLEKNNYPTLRELQYKVIVKAKGDIENVIDFGIEEKKQYSFSDRNNSEIESCNDLKVPIEELSFVNFKINEFDCYEKNYIVNFFLY